MTTSPGRHKHKCTTLTSCVALTRGCVGVRRQECELARVDCLVSPLYRKRKLMTDMEAKELLGMCMGECKRQAVDTAKQTVRFAAPPVQSACGIAVPLDQ